MIKVWDCNLFKNFQWIFNSIFDENVNLVDDFVMIYFIYIIEII